MGLWGKIYCYNERLEYLIISEMLPVYTQHTTLLVSMSIYVKQIIWQLIIRICKIQVLKEHYLIIVLTPENIRDNYFSHLRVLHISLNNVNN